MMAILFAVIAGFLVVSCDKFNGEGEVEDARLSSAPGNVTAVTGPLFGPEILAQMRNIAPFDKDELAAELDSNDLFFADGEPAVSLRLQTEISDCFAVAANQIPITVTGKEMKIGARVSLDACMAAAVESSAEAPEGYSATGFIAVYGVKVCEDGDLQAFSGKTFSELEEAEEPCKEGWGSSQTLQMEVSVSLTLQGETYVSRTLLGLTGASGGACTASRSGATVTYGECVDFAANITTLSGETATDLSMRATLTGVQEDVDTDQTYYSAGSVAFEINDWTGTATFHGPETAPTWTAAKGGETITGTIGAGADEAATLSLRGTSSQRFNTEAAVRPYRAVFGWSR